MAKKAIILYISYIKFESAKQKIEKAQLKFQCMKDHDFLDCFNLVGLRLSILQHLKVRCQFRCSSFIEYLIVKFLINDSLMYTP